MAKEKTPQKKEPLPEEVLGKFLNENKPDHFNFYEDQNYKISSGVLLWDYKMNGGLCPGAHRMLGSRESGKTSEALLFLQNFLEDQKLSHPRGVYIKSEGRLTREIMERYRIPFTTKSSEWNDRSCFIYESNVAESVFDLMRTFVKSNSDNKYNYFFIIDSADTLCKREDIEKPFEKSDQVSGGPIITSTFFKKCGLALSKFGHIAIFVAQDRAAIRIDPRQKVGQRQGNSAGGNSIQHQSSFVFQMSKDWDGIILNKKEIPIGHRCTAKIEKSTNETTGQSISYVIKYGQKEGQSIWKEYEVLDCCLVFEMITKGGKWYSFEKTLLKELKEKVYNNMPEQFDGEKNVLEFFEEHKEVTDYLYNKFKSMVNS